MKTDITAPYSIGISGATMATLLAAVFIVSVGYGIVLPLIPYSIERLLGSGAEAVQVSRHTGLLTAVYGLALFLFAPIWGRISDRQGRRKVLLSGLAGFGATMLVCSFIESIPAIYAERFLSGMFASAVVPVAAAVIGDFSEDKTRGRKLTFLSMAGIIGFLVGPMLGVFIAGIARDIYAPEMVVDPLAIPLLAVAIPLLAVAIFTFFLLPAVLIFISTPLHSEMQNKVPNASGPSVWITQKLLLLTFIVSTSVAAFEVELALLGKDNLGLTSYQIALMFAECSLVMLVMQAMVFSPWVNPEKTRWLISPMLVLLAIGLLIVPQASDFPVMLIAVGTVSASAGVLSPILVYWVSVKAGLSQGWELGKQAATISLGLVVGSALGGFLHNSTDLPGGVFLLLLVLVALGFMFSLRLPSLLTLTLNVERNES